jgi:hypothetical protein
MGSASVKLVRKGRLPFLTLPSALPTKTDSNFAIARFWVAAKECGEETPLFCRIHRRVLTLGVVLAGAGHELAGIGFLQKRVDK